MAEPVAGEEEDGAPGCVQENQQAVVGPAGSTAMSRKEKRKAAKREKRKQMRKELAAKEREEEEARLNDPEEQRRIQLEEEREKERLERERKEFEERERQFLEALEAKRKAEEVEEERRKALDEESKHNQVEHENELKEDEDWEYVEEGPPEIIWQGNEIIVKKKRVRVRKKDVEEQTRKEDHDRPTSNPLPPQSEAFTDYKNSSMVSAQQLLDNVAQQIPNFGTEQDKAHCPFHIKTGACRFGSRCSRVHFYPDKSCTLLIKNMYNGPGLAWEQDEGLEVCKEVFV
uniref:C3H1-type domain-containing protein n=1 Tax=Davidia involucrata TaxID=16924 RepID=A0A5B7AS85_DAVIN